MAKYKIGVCCTFGAGSSLMLKMNLDSVFKKMNLDAEVEVYDISSVTGMKNGLDAIFTSTALVSQVQDALKGASTIVVPVVNYFDLGKLEELTREYLL